MENVSITLLPERPRDEDPPLPPPEKESHVVEEPTEDSEVEGATTEEKNEHKALVVEQSPEMNEKHLFKETPDEVR